MLLNRQLAVVAMVALVGCGEGGSTGGESSADAGLEDDGSEVGESTASAPAPQGTAELIDLAAFELTPVELDPYTDRPDDDTCEFGFGLEDGLFEIETDLCHYGSFSQPLLAPIRAGDTVEFVLVHDALYSEDPDAVAHISIALGQDIVWEQALAIPTPPWFLRPRWTSSVDKPEGTPLHLHLHNHGVNSYRIVEMTVTYAE